MVTPRPLTRTGPQTLSLANVVPVASPSLSNRSALSMRPSRAHRDVPLRSAFSAIECTGRREAKRLMTATTVVDNVQVSSHSKPVSTSVRLPLRAAPSPSSYTTDDEVACLTGAKDNYARPVPLFHPPLAPHPPPALGPTVQGVLLSRVRRILHQRHSILCLILTCLYVMFYNKRPRSRSVAR